ncbi:MAG: Protein of unknown function (DUF1703)/Predicted AAA-ATPase [Gammaproteobacteria bacterium]|jgi:hypothetical protein|nr:Protein of unknown function (DUF1703)/Predicted AAA-ATPase [Gammaproteobacteria bacterium]
MLGRAVVPLQTTSPHFFKRLGFLSVADRRAFLDLTIGHLHTVSHPFNTRTPMMKLPLGSDDFREVIENKLDFVDKSLFLEEILEDRATKAAVITRPRRFGKTLNLSMLHNFLANTVTGEPTHHLFDGLKIAENKVLCEAHQGKYPVIFVTFKDVKQEQYEKAYFKLCELMSRIYIEHSYLLSSPKLISHQKRVFESILEERASETHISSALLNLTQALYLHHGIRPWLLIDEYDTPIQSSYVYNYYEPMINVMRDLFGSVLKTNPYLDRAVITGILRVAKESLFSGVNNLEVYSLLRHEYGNHFGFTEEEVDQLLIKADLEESQKEIKDWYNGYQVGNTVVYNPWSVVNCIKRKGELQPYWVNTSDNQLIRRILMRSGAAFKEQFELLLQDKPIEQLIDDNTVFGDLAVNELAAWSLLLMAGYLKVISQRRTAQGLWCTLEIPNKEVKDLYRQIIEQWFSNGYGIVWYNQFLDHLLTGNMEAFEREMKKVMEQTISSYDTSRDPEAFYHGLMIGLTASLHNSTNYEIQSNKESGYGRYDYMIFSRDKSRPTLLLEFKKVDAVKDIKKLKTHLEEAAHEALKQVDEKGYLSEAKRRGSTHILKIGLAFCGKRFAMKHEHTGKVLDPDKGARKTP